MIKKLSTLIATALLGCGAPVSNTNTPPVAAPAYRAGTMSFEVDPASGTVKVVGSSVGTSARGLHRRVRVSQNDDPNTNPPETFNVVTTSAIIGDGTNGCDANENCFDVFVGSFRSTESTDLTLVIDSISPAGRSLVNSGTAPPGSGLNPALGLIGFGDLPPSDTVNPENSAPQLLRFLIPNEDPYVVTFSLWEERPAGGSIVGVAGGTAAPAATLGPFTMTPFPADPSAELTDLSALDSPLGGQISFDVVVNHRIIGGSWGSWSHGYTGDVYYSNGAQSVTVTMPANTGAFYFFIEGNPFDVRTFTVVADDGTTVIQNVDGNSGASYFGFHTTGPGVNLLSVTASTDVDFALGEFGIAINDL